MANVVKAFSDKFKSFIRDRAKNPLESGRGHDAIPVTLVGDRNELLNAPDGQPKFGEFLVGPGGITNMTVVGTALAPIAFSLGPTINETMWVHEINVYIRDNGAQWNLFGGIAALVNGVQLGLMVNGVPVPGGDFLGGEVIVRNGDFVKHAVPAVIISSAGGTNDTLLASFDFVRIFGHPLKIDGMVLAGVPPVPVASNVALTCVIRDSLVNLDEFKIKVHGHRINMPAFYAP